MQPPLENIFLEHIVFFALNAKIQLGLDFCREQRRECIALTKFCYLFFSRVNMSSPYEALAQRIMAASPSTHYVVALAQARQMMSSAATAGFAAGLDPPQVPTDMKPTKAVETERETSNHEDGLEDEQEITYTPYRPKKLKYGKDHPDPVVENSTLGSVEPPDITYNLVMPADIIAEGKLSNLQLEAVVYGCQRHIVDLPTMTRVNGMTMKENVNPISMNAVNVTADKDIPEDYMIDAPVPVRAGFLLGDGAGMGKGRTLAGFVVENIARGRKKHVWVSVSSDLYEDAKRDLSDLGLHDYAEKNCYNLGKLPYGSLLGGSFNSSKSKKKKGARGKTSKSKKPTATYEEGVMFATYSTLIGKKSSSGESRLNQLLEWCGEDFDGLIMLDECHKAKTIELDENGNAKNVGKNATCSQTAAKVVELQNKLPRARVVYCSATSVSEPKNLGFMSRLGLWGPGTEHPQGFSQFLQGIERLGTGAMELVRYCVLSSFFVC